jgi:signal transduction histidine kinase
MTDPVTADVTLLIGLYSVAAYERRRWAFPAAGVVLEAGAALATLRFDAVNPLPPFATLSAFIVATGLLGIYVRTRREHIAALLARTQALERAREHEAQLATAAERARIAREMHDVVAHNLTVMITLADGAQLRAGHAPDEARAAMGSVSATGREALGEMRRLLGVLRDDDGAAAGELEPQPGMDQLEALVEQVRSTGLETRITYAGDPVPLSVGAQLTVYRVVQEALTNTLKHARSPSSSEVSLRYGGGLLSLEVTDDGAPPPPAEQRGAADGHGIAGMRERAAAYGAEVEAGPRSRGGWRVHALLRLDGAEAGG